MAKGEEPARIAFRSHWGALNEIKCFKGQLNPRSGGRLCSPIFRISQCRAGFALPQYSGTFLSSLGLRQSFAPTSFDSPNIIFQNKSNKLFLIVSSCWTYSTINCYLFYYVLNTMTITSLYALLLYTLPRVSPGVFILYILLYQRLIIISPPWHRSCT